MSDDQNRKQLIEIRQRLRFSQSAMAKHLGMSLRAYQALESGESATRDIHILAAERVAEKSYLLMSRFTEKLAEIGVDPAGTVNAEDAGIGWNLDDTAEDASDLRVIDFKKYRDRNATREDVIAWRRAGSTMGACLSEWMENPRHTPEGLFAGLLYNGDIPTKEKLIPVLREFAKIRECDWARMMLAGLYSPDLYIGGEGYNL
jgi:transcriptional regulator with XRE-family HTH domain